MTTLTKQLRNEFIARSFCSSFACSQTRPHDFKLFPGLIQKRCLVCNTVTRFPNVAKRTTVEVMKNPKEIELNVKWIYLAVILGCLLGIAFVKVIVN